MRTRWLPLCLLFVACGSPPATAEPATEPPTPEPAEARTEERLPEEPGPERRCLPIVAADCGCVYSCGVGTRDADGWSVVHPFWGETPVRARIDRWCVGEECTDAFFGEIVCGLICAPRPADPSCAFDAAGSCAGAD